MQRKDHSIAGRKNYDASLWQTKREFRAFGVVVKMWRKRINFFNVIDLGFQIKIVIQFENDPFTVLREDRQKIWIIDDCRVAE